MFKHRLREGISAVSGFLEIVVSILILVCISIVSLGIAMDICQYVKDTFAGADYTVGYSRIFGAALQIIIGIEFIKMIVKHTPGSAIEVLLFVVAKRVIVEDSYTSVDVLLGVVSIAVLFGVKKYLHHDFGRYNDGTIFSHDTPIATVRKAMNVSLPDGLGDTLGEIMQREFERCERKIAVNESLELGGALLRIHSMHDSDINKVEVIPIRKGLNLLQKLKK